MRFKRVREKVEAARAAFDRQMSELGEEARREMLPYFRKRGWRFYSDNGTYLVDDRRGREVDRDRLPVQLRAMLDVEVDHNTSLSDYVPGIRLEDVE